MAQMTINGPPGTRHLNEGTKPLFQLIADWKKPNGSCIQFDHVLARYWNIPFHTGCRCTQVPIRPGEQSRPFVDFRAKLAELPFEQRARAIGAGNLKLFEAGVVNWEDIVTRSRVRDLTQVLDRHKLTVERMVAAGGPVAWCVGSSF